MNHIQVGENFRRHRARFLAIAIGALAILSAAQGLRAEVILKSRDPYVGTPVGVAMTIGGSTDSNHQQIAIGLTMGSISMTFESMTAWINNETAESISLIGGIYTDLGGNPGTLLASFVPITPPTVTNVFGASLVTSVPVTLTANTTYWFLLDGATSSPNHTLGWLLPKDPDDPLAPSDDYEPVATPPVTFVSERTSQDSGATWRHLALAHVAFSIDATLDTSTPPVPEPSTWALCSVALVICAIGLRRRSA
jgi:hypothetical protein